MARSKTFRVTEATLSDRSSVVDDKFFGGNFLFDRDRVGDDGTFDEKAAALDIDFLRYPGGTITEESFSLRQPDRRHDAETGRDLMPLSEFIDYAASTRAAYSLVVPTINYMLAYDEGEMSLSAIRSEIRSFVTRLADGEFGGKLPTIIEIGNEFYAVEGMTEMELAKLYATVARVFAQEIRDVLGDDVEIGVQTGRFASTDAVIRDAFSGAAGDALVDKAIFHSYPWTLDKADDYTQAKMEIAQNWLKTGVAEGVFVSEFNLSNQLRGGDGELLGPNSIEMGMAKAVALVDMAIGLIGAGVDYAAVWPLQQNTNGDLAGNEGETGQTEGDRLDLEGLTLSGAAYKLLSTSVVGKRLIKSADYDLDSRAESARNETEAMVRTFDGEDEMVVFVSSWDLSSAEQGLRIDLDLPGNFGDAEIVRLYTNGDPLDQDARPVVDERTIHVGSNFGVTLAHRYEIVRITLQKIGKDERGDRTAERMIGGAKADQLNGAGGDDTVRGADGTDTLKGAGQHDLISGQRGDDALFGQRGHDTVKGGSGDDKVVGARGDDRLIGGSGDDYVRGGSGDDRLIGGSGDDRLLGHSGDDMVAGGSGDDAIVGSGGADLLKGGGGHDDLRGGAGSDTLLGHNGADSLSGQSGADVLKGGGGADLLMGGAGNDILIGGAGNDTLVGGGGADRLIGGGGADLLTSFAGNDLLTGGGGLDTFHFTAEAASRTVTITDFTAGRDRIVVEGGDLSAEDITIRSGADTLVFFGDTTLVLKGARGVDLADVALIRPGTIDDAPDVKLARGQSTDKVLGHIYAGASAPDGLATVAFDADGRDVTLNFRAFDIDLRHEVEVFLNGKSIGELDMTGNERFADQSIRIDADDQIAGENVITFGELLPAVNTWGIDELALA